MKKKILISSGGSGGHVIPATIFYDHLKDNYDVLITTDKRGDKFINKSKYKNIIFNTPNLSKNIFLLPFNLLYIFLLTLKSIIYIKKNKVNILLTTGGYMSIPFYIASKFLDIEFFLFEPNMVIGRANIFPKGRISIAKINPKLMILVINLAGYVLIFTIAFQFL